MATLNRIVKSLDQHASQGCSRLSTFIQPGGSSIKASSLRRSLAATRSREMSAFEGSSFWSSAESKDKPKEQEAKPKEEAVAAPSDGQDEAEVDEAKDERPAAEVELQTELDGVRASEAKLKEQVCWRPYSLIRWLPYAHTLFLNN